MRRLARSLPLHEATIGDLQGLTPLMGASDHLASGIYLGEDLMGRPFTFDPFELYREGRITSPNQLIVGQIGRGKSSLVKAMVLRHVGLGRSAFIVDPKGEYGALAEAAGGLVIKLSPGGSQQINPLSQSSRGNHDQQRAGHVRLLETIAASTLGRPVRPIERLVLEAALDASLLEQRSPSVRAILDRLFRPDGEVFQALGIHSGDAMVQSRDLAIELRRLVDGDLRGMVDGDDDLRVGDAGLVVVDLSALYGSDGLGVVMVCVMAWMQQVLAERHRHGTQAILVIDEAWALLRDLEAARWLQRALKLSRAWGISTVAVLHRISDLTAVGDDGSEQRALARSLLLETEVRTVFAQPASSMTELDRAISLSEIQRELVPLLPKGTALWHVGTSAQVVRHRVGSAEWDLIDTDQQLRP